MLDPVITGFTGVRAPSFGRTGSLADLRQDPFLCQIE